MGKRKRGKKGGGGGRVRGERRERGKWERRETEKDRRIRETIFCISALSCSGVNRTPIFLNSTFFCSSCLIISSKSLLLFVFIYCFCVLSLVIVVVFVELFRCSSCTNSSISLPFVNVVGGFGLIIVFVVFRCSSSFIKSSKFVPFVNIFGGFGVEKGLIGALAVFVEYW